MQAATATRAKAQLDQAGPICIYGVCETLGVVVRFNNINMEGMYQRGLPPRIHLSARRPLPRRTYNCAHELGHHVFGHGSSIDELREDAKAHPWEDPKEFLADTFAGFILMPIIGLRRAFSVRRWAPETATPAQIFTIPCEFGVGYPHELWTTRLLARHAREHGPAAGHACLAIWSRERCARSSAGRKSSRTRCVTILKIATPSSNRRWRRSCASIGKSKS
ncbi:ImmA/IrrE family metallo-endopeptidase [Bradyrhizobium sp. sBnM-33]|uniref:ImmA/IrrE family metallo-endopeptidase n=1 Tax=Bradyrhizobium TaxID=374 RepID=UPI003979AEED